MGLLRLLALGALLAGCSLLNEDREPELACNDPDDTACYDDVLAYCDSDDTVFVDCAEDRRVCREVDVEGAPPTEMCVPDCDGHPDDSQSCAFDVLLQCESGAMTQTSCIAMGQICREVGEGAACVDM